MISKKRKKTSIKNKLKTVAVSSDVTYRLKEVAVLEHDIFSSLKRLFRPEIVSAVNAMRPLCTQGIV